MTEAFLREIDGWPVPRLAAALSATPPDPAAQPYAHLDGAARFAAVVSARRGGAERPPGG